MILEVVRVWDVHGLAWVGVYMHAGRLLLFCFCFSSSCIYVGAGVRRYPWGWLGQIAGMEHKLEGT